MKIGYFTDLHARAITPVGRTDDFRVSLFKKLVECGEIFEREGVDVILCGGDITDAPDSPYSIANAMTKIFKSYGKPVFSVLGSHDYFGYQIKSLHRTAVGMLHEAKTIQLIGSDGMEKFVEFDEFVLCATPHTWWLDQSPDNYYQPRYVEGKLQFQLTHGDLMEKPAIWQHTLIKDVKTESDVVFGAHYHPGWSKMVINSNGIDFVHPGAIARLDNSGVPRGIQVVTIEIKNQQIRYTAHKLESALTHPFYDKVGNESEEDMSMDLVTRVMDLIQTTQVQLIDVKALLPKVAQELGYSNEVVDEAFSFIEQVKKN